MRLNCCVASGPRGLFTIPLTTVMSAKDGLSVIFFNPGTYKIKTPAGQVAELVQETNYPVDGVISMQLKVSRSETFNLNIRIPKWSNTSAVTVNGVAVNNVKPGEYAQLRREWKTGDKILLTLDMRGRIEVIAGKPSYLAIVRGPIVLARDKRMTEGADVDEMITPVLKDGFVSLN